MDRNRNRDLFAQLPIDLIHIILSFLFTPKKLTGPYFKGKAIYTKEAVQTTIILSKRFLEAWSSFPDLNFTDDAAFRSEDYLPEESLPENAQQFQQASMERQRFANYVLQTVTRYQQYNIPITTLRLTAQLLDEQVLIGGRLCNSEDDMIANNLYQSIIKAKGHGVKEVYLHLVHIPPSSNLIQTIFALKQLVSLSLYDCELLKKGVEYCDIFLNCSSLRTLKLDKVRINECVLQKIIQSCQLIEEIKLDSCKGIKTIRIANLPSLKRLKVFIVKNQRVYVKSESLELMTFSHDYSFPILNIHSPNLKILKLLQCEITDEQLRNFLAKFPVLEELTVRDCDEIEKINISSQSLSSLSIIMCMGLMEVKIDAPSLSMFEYHGGVRTPLFFANGGYGKIKSIITLDLMFLGEASWFLELSEFLATLKQSDNILLDISSEEVGFDRNIIDELRHEKNIPQFEEVSIMVRPPSPSSTFSTLMEGLLWSFSPKIISLKHESWEDEEFIMHICRELLVQHDPNISSINAFNCWRSYFKQAKFNDRDDEWRPLHSWKSLASVLENLGDEYILKLSHN